MKLSKLNEARKNPSENTPQTFADFMDDTISDNGGEENLFFTFQSLTKLGMNPKSPWETPSGVYAYQGEYFIPRAMKGIKQPYRNPINNKLQKPTLPPNLVPYGMENLFLYSFSFKGNLLNLSDQADRKKLHYLVVDQIGEDKLFQILMKLPEFSYHKDAKTINDLINVNSFSSDYISILMKVIYYICDAMILDDNFGIIEKPRTSSNPVNTSPTKVTAWFMSKGIDGLIDHGSCIIYNTEPHQTVIFNTKLIKVLDLFVVNRRRATKNPSAVNTKSRLETSTYGDPLTNFNELIEIGDVEQITINLSSQIKKFADVLITGSDNNAVRTMKIVRAFIKKFYSNYIIPCEQRKIKISPLGGNLKYLVSKIDEMYDAIVSLIHLLTSSESIAVKNSILSTDSIKENSAELTKFLADRMDNFKILDVMFYKSSLINDIVEIMMRTGEPNKELNSLVSDRIQQFIYYRIPAVSIDPH